MIVRKVATRLVEMLKNPLPAARYSPFSEGELAR
jgi:hypothetical protein